MCSNYGTFFGLGFARAGVLASAKPEVRSGAYRRDDGVLVIPVSLLGA